MDRDEFAGKWSPTAGGDAWAADLKALLQRERVAGAASARDRFVSELWASAREHDELALEHPDEREVYRRIASAIRELGTVLHTLSPRDLAQVLAARAELPDDLSSDGQTSTFR
jgi:hypothetical protein